MKENYNSKDSLTIERLPTPSFSNSLGKQSTDTEIFNSEIQEIQNQTKRNNKIESINSKTQKNLKQFPYKIFSLKSKREIQKNHCKLTQEKSKNH